MSEIENIKMEIQRAILAGEFSKTQLARKASVPITTLIGMEKKGWNPHSHTLAALEVALAELRAKKARPKQRRGAFQPAA
jgi:hypothetical protein